jgi:sterol desaturase/sphingolipid hydroxylase (fatty acid hydroxylase superfamily)
MDTTYGKAVALAVPVFLFLIFVELGVDLWRRTRYYRLADAINSLSCGIVSTGMRVFFGFLGIYTYEWTLNHAAVVHLPANHWATWVFAFLAYDLCYYWNHRLGHTVGLFWASHVVHHQSEEFNLTTALRQTGTGSFFGWIFYVPMAICGVPLSVFLLVAVAQLFYQFWPHTRHIGRMGVLDRWIQTPSNHRVHHAQNDIYLDRNYVGVFLIWDHLFGTFQEELDEEPCIYGIRGQLNSWNPVWANLHYYWAMAKDFWHARSWLDKIRVWFAPPGWRPPDVAERFPKAAYDPNLDFLRFDPERGLGLSVYCLVQFVALISANSHFLNVLPKAGLATTLAYFLYITIALITIGGVLENRPEFFRLETARLLLTAIAVIITGSWFGGVHDPRAIAGVVAFCVLSSAGLLFAARLETKRAARAVAA